MTKVANVFAMSPRGERESLKLLQVRVVWSNVLIFYDLTLSHLCTALAILYVGVCGYVCVFVWAYKMFVLIAEWLPVELCQSQKQSENQQEHPAHSSSSWQTNACHTESVDSTVRIRGRCLMLRFQGTGREGREEWHEVDLKYVSSCICWWRTGSTRTMRVIALRFWPGALLATRPRY